MYTRAIIVLITGFDEPTGYRKCLLWLMTRALAQRSRRKSFRKSWRLKAGVAARRVRVGNASEQTSRAQAKSLHAYAIRKADSGSDAAVPRALGMACSHGRWRRAGRERGHTSLPLGAEGRICSCSLPLPEPERTNCTERVLEGKQTAA